MTTERTWCRAWTLVLVVVFVAVVLCILTGCRPHWEDIPMMR
jgi:hypothetical protein